MLETAAVIGGFDINGDVPEAGAAQFSDPFGAVKELGPVNENTTKLGVIHTDGLPTLGFTDVPGQTDLENVWLDTNMVGDDIWLYFAWERDSTNGSGVIGFEFQQAAAPAACDYSATGIDQVEPISSAEQALIDSCNPWTNRQEGDFLIVWDQQGQTITISVRFFDGTQFGDPQVIDSVDAAAALSADTSRGEAAINLSTTVFPEEPTECLNIANIVPGTITGNSDRADYKDTVLTDFTDTVTITNCGQVEVVKATDPTGETGTFPYTLAQADGGDVDFDSTNGATVTGTLTEDGDSDLLTELITDSDYTLSEDLSGSPDWELTSIVCVDPSGTSTDVTNGVTFAVAVGDRIVCTITNKLAFVADPQVSLVKTADPTEVDAVDQEVTYSYVVTNTGNTALTNVVLTDDNATPGETGDDFEPTFVSGDTDSDGRLDADESVEGRDTDADGKLDAAEIWNYTATRTITQADLDAGAAIVNIATVDTNETEPVTDDANVTVSQSAEIELVKTGTFQDEDGNTFADVGETIIYSFTVTNTGNVTLTNVTLTDTVGGVTISGGPIASLAPGASDNTTFEGTYTITQEDIDAGTFHNVAQACGTAPDDTDVCDEDDHDEPLPQNRALDIEKSTNGEDADTAPGPQILVGDPVEWEYVVTNTGNVALTDVTVMDDQDVTVTCSQTTLAVGASMTCTASGTATAGQYANIGIASSGDASDSDPSHYYGATPAVDIEKSTNGFDADDPSDAPVVPVGSNVTWTYLVTNTGDIDLSNVDVTDDQGVVVECPATSLAAGADMECTASGTAEAFLYANIGTVITDEGVSDSDPSHYIGQADVCEDGKPNRLFLLYNGSGPDGDSHSQTGSEVIIAGDANGAEPVTIRVYDHRDKLLDTYDAVMINDILAVEQPGNKLIPPRTLLEVYDGSTLLETAQFHTSCSQPLNGGDEYGSFLLVGDE